MLIFDVFLEKAPVFSSSSACGMEVRGVWLLSKTVAGEMLAVSAGRGR